MRKFYPFALAVIFYVLPVMAHAQNVTVNPGAGSYATLKAAFDAINAGTHTGSITISITANTTETATATLNASGSGSASYSSVQITPSGTITVTGSLAAPLISLNGADNVTINGSGTLTLSNTSTSTTSGTSTIRLINDASNNLITNCIILGSSALAANSTTATGVVLFSTGTITGNDNNVLSNNDISSAGANLASRGIASFGSASFANSGNQVANNNVYNIFQTTYSAAIQLNDNNNNWTINNNRIYQTATRNGTGTGINYGIWIDGSTVAEQFTIANNIIGYGSNTQTGGYKVTGTSTTFQGISYTGKPTTLASNITANTIASVTVSSTASVNYAINVNIAAAGGIPVNISNNIITGITSTGNVYAISVTGAGTNRASTINANNMTAITLSGTARFYGILYNGGDGGLSSAISNNTISDVILDGTASGSATGSPALNVIYVASGPTSVTDNIIGSQTVPSISCSQTAGSTSSFDLLGIFVKGVDNNTISNNTIGGLYADNSLATSGTARIFGIRNSSTGTITCSANTIGGTVNNSIQLNSAFAGASILAIYNSAGTSAFTGNIIRNITSGAGTGTAANSSLVGLYNASANATTATGNSVYNLSSPGVSVGGIIFAAGATVSIAGNTVYNIMGSGSGGVPVVTGIQLSGGTVANVYKNKIYGLSQTSAFVTAGGVNGLLLSGGTTVTAYNNIIGQLNAPAANSIDAIRGISVISNTAVTSYKLYYNTVYLNATTGGATFGSSAVFHIGNAVATTATLDLKNNILVNTSSPAGTGLTAALKRWPNTGSGAADLSNYDVTSNNNLFYAGTPAADKLIYSDSLNADQTLAQFKARVAPRESASVTEMPPFASTNGADATFLHISPSVATLVESHGANIAGITDDYDSNTRQGNAGYSGTGTAPDIGADEGEFTAAVMPVSLLSFSGEAQEHINRLFWITSTETNNNGFVIERGIDGKHFTAIASIPSKAINGNSTTQINYSYSDTRVLTASAYYRLLQMDKDGRVTYSNIIRIKRSPAQTVIAAAFPNPAKEVLHVAISSVKDETIDLVVTDLGGRIVLKQSSAVTKGDNLISLDIRKFSAGQYFITALDKNGSETAVYRFVKQ
jgi:hypothetical protein